MPFQYFDDFCHKSKLPSTTSLTIKTYHNFTAEKLSLIRDFLERKLPTIKANSKYCVVAVGSYGRYEASPVSDFDVYVIYEKDDNSRIKRKIDKYIKKAAEFAEIKPSGFNSIPLSMMYKNIGGKDDSNSSITNRILFLLESECLYNYSFSFYCYEKILKKYLKDFLKSQKKVPRFLLSDIIRYYRTICVDYEFKTVEQNKEWATRNIKLRFSRKGLYFGGVAVLLNSLNKRNPQRYNYILKNLGLPFADKMSHILSDQKMTRKHRDLLILYASFLKEIGKNDVRSHLNKLKKEDKEKSKIFRKLTGKSDQFNDRLIELLNEGYWGGENYLDFLIL